MSYWRLQRVGRVARTISGSGFPHEYQGRTTGDLPVVKVSDLGRNENRDGIQVSANYISRTDIKALGARIVPAGSVIFPKVGAALLGNARSITRRECILDNNLMAISPREGDVRYWKYALSLVDLGEYSGSGPLPYVNESQIRELSIPFPLIDEQRRIADFLDGETARLNTIAERRTAQVAALDELEISRILEKLSGADQQGDRKVTGWPWLPRIPADWPIGPVYAYFDVQLGKMLNAERTSGENQLPYLRNANIKWYGLNSDDLKTMTFEPGERERYSLKAGDLMVCEGGYVGQAAVWDGRFSPCFYQKSLHRVRATSNIPVEWLMYWLRSASAAGTFEANGNLSTIQHLTREQLAEYRIPIPPDGPRRVSELASEIGNIRKAQLEISSATALLAERRKALITAAVTGQLDVTTAGSFVPSGGVAA